MSGPDPEAPPPYGQPAVPPPYGQSAPQPPYSQSAPQPPYGQPGPLGYPPAQQPYGYPAMPPQYPMPVPPPAVENPAPYHRLFRTARSYAWWRPLVAVALFVVFFLVAQLVVGVVWVIGAILTGGFGSLSSIDSLLAHVTDVSDPLNLVLLLGSIAIMLPLVPVAMLCAGLRPVGLRHSVMFRLRWRWMLWCAIPALVITAVSNGLSFIPGLSEPLPPVPVDPAGFAVAAVLIVLLAPLQSAAEEYVFRGLIMQTIGAWVRSPWPGILISTVIFTVGHTQYEIWGLLSVGIMGLGFAIVVWRTGGLEAGIAFHVVNNVVALLLLASGVLGTTAMTSEGSGPLAPIVQAVFTAAYVLWIEIAARRMGISRARELAPAPLG